MSKKRKKIRILKFPWSLVGMTWKEYRKKRYRKL